MKLIMCCKCSDVVRLMAESPRTCKCGSSGGQYHEDKLNAVYWGDEAMPLGIDNSSLLQALGKQPEAGPGQVFHAFVIPKVCPTFVKIPTPPPGYKWTNPTAAEEGPRREVRNCVVCRKELFLPDFSSHEPLGPEAREVTMSGVSDTGGAVVFLGLMCDECFHSNLHEWKPIKRDVEE